MVDALELALSAPPAHLVAVGEIGLHAPSGQPLEVQRSIFSRQLVLADRAALPVCLHVLGAHGPALELLEARGPLPRGGVVHSYSGPPELVPRYLALGLSLSFSGSVTWHPKNRAARSAAACPQDRLLVETDAPDQTPLPHRPGENEPAFLLAIVDTIATIRSENAAAVATYTHENANRLFGIR
jgi:TatD DNase family protein